jgi:hypothetical protein
MKLRKITHGVSGLSLIAIVACGSTGTGEGPAGATDGSEPVAETNANLSVVLRLEPQVGHVITFYEIRDAGLFLVESSHEGQTPVMRGAAQDAIAVFQKVRPGEQVPAELQDAYDRAKSVVAEQDPAELKTLATPTGGGQPAPEFVSAIRSTSEVGVAQQATSSSNPGHFTGSHGGCDATGSKFSGCRVNWGGGFWASWTPSSSATCHIDHYAGNGITAQLTAGATVVPFGQAVGTLQTYSWGLVAGNITRRLDILNAAGDSFHVGCEFF